MRRVLTSSTGASTAIAARGMASPTLLTPPAFPDLDDAVNEGRPLAKRLLLLRKAFALPAEDNRREAPHAAEQEAGKSTAGSPIRAPLPPNPVRSVATSAALGHTATGCTVVANPQPCILDSRLSNSTKIRRPREIRISFLSPCNNKAHCRQPRSVDALSHSMLSCTSSLRPASSAASN